jgi:hypothetical protein
LSRDAGLAKFEEVPGGGYLGISKELTMTKSILVSLAILTLATSAAFAAHPTHHRHVINASASVAPPPVMWMGGVNSGDHDTYMKNLRDSGYNTKNNYNSFGNLATQ